MGLTGAKLMSGPQTTPNTLSECKNNKSLTDTPDIPSECQGCQSGVGK